MWKTGRSYLAEDLSADLADFIESIPVVDRIQVEAKQLSVKEARELVRLSWQKPVYGRKVIIINGSEKLSDVVQNTLLKLLEEPPRYLIIFLITDKPGSLLGTVLSRLERIKANKRVGDEKDSVVIKLEDYQKAKEYFSAIRDREEAISSFKQLIKSLKKRLLANYSQDLVKQVELADQVVQRLSKNLNWKLSIDWFLLRWFDN